MMDYETDYLVIGGGAMGLAFVDTMLKETDARRLKQQDISFMDAQVQSIESELQGPDVKTLINYLNDR